MARTTASTASWLRPAGWRGPRSAHPGKVKSCASDPWLMSLFEVLAKLLFYPCPAGSALDCSGGYTEGSARTERALIVEYEKF